MTGAAGGVVLLMGELLDADDLEVRGHLSLGRGLHHFVVFPGGAVAGLAVDARLRPGGAVGVGLQIIIAAELADVAVKAGGVEGCLLYTSPSPRDRQKSRMPSSA